MHRRRMAPDQTNADENSGLGMLWVVLRLKKESRARRVGYKLEQYPIECDLTKIFQFCRFATRQTLITPRSVKPAAAVFYGCGDDVDGALLGATPN